jgi:hypothetical protein
MRADVEFASCLRDLTGDEERDIATARGRLQIQYSWRVHISSQKFAVPTSSAVEPVMPPGSIMEILTKFVSELSKSKSHKLVIGYHVVYIYSNDLDWLEQLSKIPQGTVKFTQAQVTTSKGSVLVKNSAHQYRTYFKQALLTTQEKTFVANWLKNQQNIRMSPSLKNYCNNGHSRTYGNFFFDHGDLKLLQMLTLVRPNLVRETRNIVNEPLNN